MDKKTKVVVAFITLGFVLVETIILGIINIQLHVDVLKSTLPSVVSHLSYIFVGLLVGGFFKGSKDKSS